MRDLVDLIWVDLRSLVGGIRDLKARGKPPRPFDELQVDALCWALVVLSSDSPAGDTGTVDDYLEELLEREPAEIRTEIVTAFRDLW